MAVLEIVDGPLSLTPFEPAVFVLGLNGEEHISRPFSYEIRLLSFTHHDINAFITIPEDQTPGSAYDTGYRSILFEKLGLLLNDESAAPARYFHGYVANFAQAVKGEGVPASKLPLHESRSSLLSKNVPSEYVATIVPWTWFLRNRRDSRIFERRDVKEIVTEVFSRYGAIADVYEPPQDEIDPEYPSLSGTYVPYETCVQYRESDLDFVSRLLEREAIHTFFKHTEESHQLVMMDEMAHRANMPTPPGWSLLNYVPGDLVQPLSERVYAWRRTHRVDVDSVHHTDYTFRDATNPISQFGPDPAPASPYQVHTHPGDAVKVSEDVPLTDPDTQDHIMDLLAARYAQFDSDRLDAERVVFRATSGHRGLIAGYKFKLKQELAGPEYLITSLEFKIESDRPGSIDDTPDIAICQTEFSALATGATWAYRPPRRTPAPVVSGPQSAVVVDDNGVALDQIRVELEAERDNELNKQTGEIVDDYEAYVDELQADIDAHEAEIDRLDRGHLSGIERNIKQKERELKELERQSPKTKQILADIDAKKAEIDALKTQHAEDTKLRNWHITQRDKKKAEHKEASERLDKARGSDADDRLQARHEIEAWHRDRVNLAFTRGMQTRSSKVDEFGRVRVRFPWSRRAESSCWVRVSQLSAGNKESHNDPHSFGNWGSMFVPHVGSEVIVEFIDGDPDRPIITGRVFNSDMFVPRPLDADDHRPTGAPGNERFAANPQKSVIQDHGGNFIMFDGQNTDDIKQQLELYSPTANSQVYLGHGRTAFHHSEDGTGFWAYLWPFLHTSTTDRRDGIGLDTEGDIVFHAGGTVITATDSDEHKYRWKNSYSHTMGFTLDTTVGVGVSITIAGKVDLMAGIEIQLKASYALEATWGKKITVQNQESWEVNNAEKHESTDKDHEVSGGESVIIRGGAASKSLKSSFKGGFMGQLAGVFDSIGGVPKDYESIMLLDKTGVFIAADMHGTADESTTAVFGNRPRIECKKSGDIAIWSEKASVVVKKDGTISIGGKDLKVGVSGDIDLKAGGNVNIAGKAVDIKGKFTHPNMESTAPPAPPPPPLPPATPAAPTPPAPPGWASVVAELKSKLTPKG